MPGEREKLTVILETNIKSYTREMSGGARATKGFASETEKAAGRTEVSGKRINTAFSRVKGAISEARREAAKPSTHNVDVDDSAIGRTRRAIKTFKAELGRGATLNVNEKGTAMVGAKLSALDTRLDAVDGRDVTVDINADQKGLNATNGGLRELSGNIRGVATVLAASAIPLGISAIGAGTGLVTALAASTAGLALQLGKAAAGFSLVGGVAAGGAYAGLFAYSKLLGSVVTGSREAYEATHEHAMELLEKRRAEIENTKSSKAFNAEINRQLIGFSKLRAAVGTRVFPLFTKEMRAWGGVLRDNQGEIVDTAGSVANIGAKFSQWFRTAEQGKVLDRTLGFINRSAFSGAAVVSQLGRAGVMAIQPLIPLATNFQNEVIGITDEVQRWTESAQGQSRLRAIYQGLWQDAKQVGPVLMNAGRGLFNIFDAIDSAGLGTQAIGGLDKLTAGFARATAKGTETRDRINSFLRNTKALMPAVGQTVMAFGGQFFRVADAVLKARNEGSKLTILQGMLKGLKESAKPLGDLLIGTFKGLGPELVKLIPNVARLAETFAGSSGPLKTYFSVLNRAMSIFNSLPGPVKSTVANLVALKLIMSTMGAGAIPGMIGSLIQLRINQRLLAGQSRILATTQKGVATSNAAVGATSAGAATKVGFLSGALRVLRTVMLTVVLPVAAVAALGAAFFIAYKKSDRFKQAIDRQDKALIGNKNTMKLSEEGLKGFGDISGDNRGISILWAKSLDKVKASFKGNKEELTPFNRAMINLRERMQDNKGLSGGWSGTLKMLKNRITDNQGASKLWTHPLKTIKGSLGDNKGLSKAWSGALEGLGKRLRDNKGLSGGFSGALKSVKKNLTDNKGASGLLRDALGKLGNKFSDLKKGASSRMEEMKKNLSNRWKETKENASSRFSEIVQNGRNRFSELRDNADSRAKDLRAKVSTRIKDLGSDLKTSFNNQVDNARERASEMRDNWASRASDLKKKVGDRIRELGGDLKKSWSNQLSAAREFGDKFRDQLGDRFGGAVNKARKWLGYLAGAVAGILRKIGAEGMADDFSAASDKLQTPIKFARGGVYKADAGGVAGPGRMGIVGEAGHNEAIVNLEKRTPESQRAAQAVLTSPNTPVPNKHSQITNRKAVNLAEGENSPGARRLFGQLRRDPNTRRRYQDAPRGRGGGSGLPPKMPWNLRRGDSKVDYYTTGGNIASLARSGANPWRGLVQKGGRDARVYRANLSGTGAIARTWSDGRIQMGINAKQTAMSHEFGHALGLGHGGHSIMGGAGRVTPEDFRALQKYYGIGPGDGSRSAGNDGSSKYKGRTDDQGAGAGQFGKTANHLWDSETFGRVLEVLKRYKVSANTYTNHPPGYPGLAGKSADFWDYNGRGTPISLSLDKQVHNFIRTRLNRGLSWSLHEGDPGHSGGTRHVHGTWKGSDPTVPNVPYRSISGGGGGIDWMGIIEDGLSAIPDFPNIPGAMGTGFASIAPMMLDKAKDWLISYAKDKLGDLASGVGGHSGGSSPGGLTLQEAITQAGWASSQLATAVGVAWEESSARADVKNNIPGSDPYGLFQIRKPFAQDVGRSYGKLGDPIYNAHTALLGWRKWGWSPWSAYPPSGSSMRMGDKKITGYHLGGVIPGAQGQRKLALVHGGERILPAHINRSFEKMTSEIEKWAQHSSRSRLHRAGGGADRRFEQALNRLEKAMLREQRIILDNVEELVEGIGVEVGNLTESKLFQRKAQQETGKVMKRARRLIGEAN